MLVGLCSLDDFCCVSEENVISLQVIAVLVITCEIGFQRSIHYFVLFQIAKSRRSDVGVGVETEAKALGLLCVSVNF